MVMTFFNEKIIVFFNHYVLSMNYSCLFDFLHELVVKFGPFFNKGMFGQVAMTHFTGELSLKQEDTRKPKNSDETKWNIESEKQEDGNDDGEGNFYG